VLRWSDREVATVVAGGVTVYVALKAHAELETRGTPIRVIDAYSVEPIDAPTLLLAARETGRLITVEDHYLVGGLGDAVTRAVASAGFVVTRLAVREIPRSGRPDELMDLYGISARHIVAAVSAPRAPETAFGHSG
jgi:transketolase